MKKQPFYSKLRVFFSLNGRFNLPMRSVKREEDLTIVHNGRIFKVVELDGVKMNVWQSKSDGINQWKALQHSGSNLVNGLLNTSGINAL